VMEQSEVAPASGCRRFYTYDVDGRKVSAGSGSTSGPTYLTTATWGPPSQSIEIIRSELNDLTAETPASERVKVQWDSSRVRIYI